ncbi:MAG: hypothetical protein MRY83_02890 [Flavobacteriales bacterium]|nr:hypothetical protein [Flavobacteriales bacterium]
MTDKCIWAFTDNVCLEIEQFNPANAQSDSSRMTLIQFLLNEMKNFL